MERGGTEVRKGENMHREKGDVKDRERGSGSKGEGGKPSSLADPGSWRWRQERKK